MLNLQSHTWAGLESSLKLYGILTISLNSDSGISTKPILYHYFDKVQALTSSFWIIEDRGGGTSSWEGFEECGGTEEGECARVMQSHSQGRSLVKIHWRSFQRCWRSGRSGTYWCASGTISWHWICFLFLPVSHRPPLPQCQPRTHARHGPPHPQRTLPITSS